MVGQGRRWWVEGLAEATASWLLKPEGGPVGLPLPWHPAKQVPSKATRPGPRTVLMGSS